MGSDFCIPRETGRSYTLHCDIVNRRHSSNKSRAFPTPTRTWSLDESVLYEELASFHSNPNLRDNPEFYIDRAVLHPDYIVPPVLSALHSGHLSLNLHLRNISSLSGRTLEQARDEVFDAIVGEWKCDVENVFGKDSATTTISLCPPTLPGKN